MKLENSNQVKHGDVLHCRRDTFLSKAISYITKSKKTSHTAIVLTVLSRTYVVDSQWDGTRWQTFEDWNDKYNYDVIITRPPEHYYTNIDLFSRVSDYLNVGYGYIDILRHLILNWFGIWIGSKREDKNLVCSEFVLRVFGYQEAYKSNPLDAYIWCLENGFKIHKK